MTQQDQTGSAIAIGAIAIGAIAIGAILFLRPQAAGAAALAQGAPPPAPLPDPGAAAPNPSSYGPSTGCDGTTDRRVVLAAPQRAYRSPDEATPSGPSLVAGFTAILANQPLHGIPVPVNARRAPDGGRLYAANADAFIVTDPSLAAMYVFLRDAEVPYCP